MKNLKDLENDVKNNKIAYEAANKIIDAVYDAGVGHALILVDSYKMDFDYSTDLYNDELAYQESLVSNCCSATVLNPDSNGHGTCEDCRENCTSEEINE